MLMNRNVEDVKKQVPLPPSLVRLIDLLQAEGLVERIPNRGAVVMWNFIRKTFSSALVTIKELCRAHHTALFVLVIPSKSEVLEVVKPFFV